MILHVEKSYGYKLPESYIELLRNQNGGVCKLTACGTSLPTSWADDHCQISGIFGIDPDMLYSLVGKQFNNKFWNQEWGYPDIGLYVCDCPSAGHDMIALDYSQCGRVGEPTVVHIDQESGYYKTIIAGTFSEFIRKLKSSESYG